MISGDDTFMVQNALLTSSSGHGDEPIARQSQDCMLTVFAILFRLDIIFLKHYQYSSQQFGLVFKQQYYYH